MKTAGRTAFCAASAIQAEVDVLLGPPEQGRLPRKELVLPFSLARGTRGYIECVVNQINGSYENGWYDASAVMIRRLLETLIIECFEHHGLATKIMNAAGDFVYLGDLIDACMKEGTWNLTRACRSTMPKLKAVGDKSAHSRRFNAHRGDIAPLAADIRLVVQELIYLGGLR